MAKLITTEEKETYEAMKASALTPTMLVKSQLRINASTSIDVTVIATYTKVGDTATIHPLAMLLNDQILDRLTSPEGFDSYAPNDVKGKSIIVAPNEGLTDPNRKIITLKK